MATPSFINQKRRRRAGFIGQLAYWPLAVFIMTDSTLARVSSALTSLSIGSMRHTAGQSGNGGSASNNDRSNDQQGSESNEPFVDVYSLFDAEKDAEKYPSSPLQSFADFIVMHNLSSHVHVVPHYHGPKLVKLASLVAGNSD